MGANVSAARFLRTANISGNVYEQSTTEGGGANNTTIASYATAGLFATIQLVPTTTQTATATVPAAPATAVGKGWRDAVAQDATNQITWDAVNWTVRLRMLASASQSCLTTVIVYRLSGATSTEIGRGTATTALTTTVATVSITVPASAGLVFAAGDKIQVEVYVTTLTLGVATPPALAMTITCRIAETDANSGAKTTPGTYSIQYVRSASGTVALSSTAARVIAAGRSGTGTLALSSTVVKSTAKAPMVAMLVLTSTVTKAIALVPKVATIALTSTVTKAIALVPKVATLALTSTMSRTISAVRSFSTTLTLSTVFARSIIYARSFSTTITLTATGAVQLSFTILNRIVGGGGAIVRRMIAIFDD